MTHDELPELTVEEKRRYARHLVLPDIGEIGQRRLKAARVLVVGLGGLGSPIGQYLAAAGVGTLGLVDPDTVGLSNLQRQVLHSTAGVGSPKCDSALRRLRDLNPLIRIHAIQERFSEDNALRLASGYDLLIDGSDNLETRYLMSSTCLDLGIPFVYGAVFQMEGHVSVLCAEKGPCYRCLFPTPPAADLLPSAEEAGILGVVPGTIGTLQATEAIKWIVGFGTPLVGKLLIYDAREASFEVVHLLKNDACPQCGSAIHR